MMWEYSASGEEWLTLLGWFLMVMLLWIFGEAMWRVEKRLPAELGAITPTRSHGKDNRYINLLCLVSEALLIGLVFSGGIHPQPPYTDTRVGHIKEVKWWPPQTIVYTENGDVWVFRRDCRDNFTVGETYRVTLHHTMDFDYLLGIETLPTQR